MKIQSPWMGRVRGSAGQMTGCKTYDKNVLRAKAFEVSNPNTAAQQSERGFFAQVMNCVSSVSEAQLRTLFGVKPKGKSRRNALTSQLTSAYSVINGQKQLDLTQIVGIGNGEKVTTPIWIVTTDGFDDGDNITPAMMPGFDPTKSSLVFVGFDTENNVIHIDKMNFEPRLPSTFGPIDFGFTANYNGIGYMTMATDGSNVSNVPFGSFTIKTRIATN